MTETTTPPAHLRLSQMILALWVPQAIHAAAMFYAAASGPLPEIET